MRKQLADPRRRDLRMQTPDVLPDGVVQAKPALFAKLHDARRGEALRMGGDTETVPWRHRLAAGKVGETEGLLEDDTGFVSNGDHTAWLLRVTQLVFEPLRDVVERGLQPVIHALPLCGREGPRRPPASV